MKRLSWWIVALFVLMAVGSPSVLAAGPTGKGPDDPLGADGSWQTVPANASLWYYFDYPGDRSKVEVDLDTNGVQNIQLKILTPDQAKAYVQDPTTTPIGVGTVPGANSQAAIHDLVWLGGFNFPGRIFAVVVNNNPSPVSTRVTINGTNIAVGPTPTATPLPDFMKNPFATPIPTGSLQGKLVFQEASGGNIYTVNGDGSNLTRITSGLDPSWSPDGTKIAFSRWNPPAGVFIVDANGANEHGIFQGDKIISPEWSPDGSRVAFSIQKGGTTEEKQICFRGQCFTFLPDPHWKIGVVNATNGTLSEPQCSLHCFSPTWSSDNQTLAYADAQFGILTTGTAPNSGPASNLFTQNPNVQSPVYSPDGSKIVFQLRQADHWEINWINADGSNQTPVTQADPLSFQVVNNVAPTWSPDGKQILFLSDRNGKWEFFANVDGSGLTQVLKNVTDQVPIRYNSSNERVIDWSK